MTNSTSSLVPDVPPEALPLYVDTPRTSDSDQLERFRDAPTDDELFAELEGQFANDRDQLVSLLFVRATGHHEDTEAAELLVRAADLCDEDRSGKDKAARLLAQALQRHPALPDAPSRLEQLYLELDWFDAAAELNQWQLDHCIEPDAPERGRLHLRQGDHHRHRSLRLDRAVEQYRAALEYPICEAEARGRLVHIYVQAGAWADARELLELELTTLNPQLDAHRISEVHVQLAYILVEQQGELSSGERHLQIALASEVESVELAKQCAVLTLRGQGDPATQRRDAADQYIRAGGIAEQAGELVQARKLALRALELDPGREATLITLERLLAANHDWQQLKRCFELYLSAADERGTAAVRERFGKLLADELGQSFAARLQFERARDLEPGRSESYDRLFSDYEASQEWYALAELIRGHIEALKHGQEVDSATHAGVSIELLLTAARIHEKHLDDGARAAIYYYDILQQDLFNEVAAEGYKSHFIRRHAWPELKTLLDFRLDTALSAEKDKNDEDTQPLLSEDALADEFVQLADVQERRLGDISASLGTWRRFSERFPEDTRAETQIARIEKRLQIWDNMITNLEKELDSAESRESKAELCGRLAQLHRDRFEDPSKAIAYYEQHAELSGTPLQRKALIALLERTGDHPSILKHLLAQLEDTDSNSERLALLRRAGELAHHQLEDSELALQLSERLLDLAPKSTDALHRMASIHAEQGEWQACASVLSREVEVSSNPQARLGILRRVAEIHGRDEAAKDDEVSTLQTLVERASHDLQLRDWLAAALARHGLDTELKQHLEATLDAPQTPKNRHFGILEQLARLDVTEQPELAMERYAQAHRLETADRQVLMRLAELQRSASQHIELERSLDLLGDLALDDDDRRQITWERAELLAEELDDPRSAAELLLELADERAPDRTELDARVIRYLRRAQAHAELVSQTELALLGRGDDVEAQRELHDSLVEIWRTRGDHQRALVSYARFTGAYPSDIRGLRQRAELEVGNDQRSTAIATLARVSELVEDETDKIATMHRMAALAEAEGDREQALELLHQAVRIDFEHEEAWHEARSFVARHGAWPRLVELLDEKLAFHSLRGALEEQRQTCLECADICDDHLADPTSAFNWLKRAFFLAVDDSPLRASVQTKLRILAEEHELYEELYAVLIEELERRTAAAPEPSEPSVEPPDNETTEAEGEPSPDADSETRAFDVSEAYLDAATLAERKLSDPQRGLALLESAIGDRPDDAELLACLERMAQEHEIWPPLIRRHQAALRQDEQDNTQIQERYLAIANIFDHQLDRPQLAFRWLRSGWTQLKQVEGGTEHAERLHGAMAELCHRRGLLEDLALHLDARARASIEGGDWSQASQHALDAAELFRDSLDDPIRAARCLIDRIVGNPLAQEVVDYLKQVTSGIAGSSLAHASTTAALLELEALERALRNVDDDSERAKICAQRAGLREFSLDDTPGAIAEWLRVRQLRTDDNLADDELSRLVQGPDCEALELFLLGWRLQATDDASERQRLYTQLAETYEDRLDRTEYAFRAKLQHFRLDPQLPNHLDGASEAQGELWRLAQKVGEYRGPALPGDGALMPRVTAPESADLERWSQIALDRDLLFRCPSEDEASQAQLGAPDWQDLRGREDIPAEALEDREDTSSPEPDNAEAENDALDAEELDIIDVELVEVEGPAKPPVSLGQVYPGCPALPKLDHTILPPRPALASAWLELAQAYGELATDDSPREQAKVHLFRAFMWDQSANQTELAFEELERALLRQPNWAPALIAAEALAERTGEQARLVQAYDWLLEHAHRPDDGIAMAERLAAMHAKAGEVEASENYYQKVLNLRPTHTGALEALSSQARARNDLAQFAGFETRVLDLRRNELPAEERIARAMQLVQVHLNELEQRDAAIDRLRILLTDHPEHHPAHLQLIDILIGIPQWTQAIEAMRNAMAYEDEPQRKQRWRKIAGIYRNELELPDRAIDAWREVTAIDPEDQQAHAQLTELYELTQRNDRLLEAIDLQLSRTDAPEELAQLRLRRASALLEGLEQPEQAKIELDMLNVNGLEARALAEHCRLRGLLGDHETAQRELEEAFTAASTPADIETLGLALVDSLETARGERSGDGWAALEQLERVAGRYPRSNPIQARRQQLSEKLRESASEAQIARLTRIERDARARGSDPSEALAAAHELLSEPSSRDSALELFTQVLSRAPRADGASWARTPTADERLSATSQLVEQYVRSNQVGEAELVVRQQLSEFMANEHGEQAAELQARFGEALLASIDDAQQSSAKAQFEAAVHLAPQNLRAQLGLARIELAAGERRSAEHRLSEALDGLESPPPPRLMRAAVLCLANALTVEGRDDEAFRRLNALLPSLPQDVQLRTAIARNRFKAGRQRDVLSCAQQLRKIIESEDCEAGPADLRDAGEAFVLAARCELDLLREKGALDYLELALQLDPELDEALELRAQLHHKLGDHEAAGRDLLDLAELTDASSERVRRLIHAGGAFERAHADCMGRGDTEDAEENGSSAELLRQACLDAIQRALTVKTANGSVQPSVYSLSRSELDELAELLAAIVEWDLPLALDGFRSCLQATNADDELRHHLVHRLLDTAEDGRHTLDKESRRALQSALEPARQAAVKDARLHSAALQLAESLPDTDGPTVGDLVQSYFSNTETDLLPKDPLQIAPHVELRLRAHELDLIDSQGRRLSEAGPDSLAWIGELTGADSRGAHFDLRLRRRIEALLRRQGQTAADATEADATAENDLTTCRVANLRAILREDAGDAAELECLAQLEHQRGRFAEARAVHQALLWLDPEAEESAAYLRTHPEVHEPETRDDNFDLGEWVERAAPPQAGVPTALGALWSDAHSLISEQLRLTSYAPPGRDEAGQLPGSLERAWRSCGELFTVPRVVINARHIATSVAGSAERQLSVAGVGAIRIEWSNPRVISVDSASLAARGEAAARFAFARVLYLLGEPRVLTACLEPDQLTTVISASLQAFHPRHARRRHSESDSHSDSRKLGLELNRKLSIRIARQIDRAFKTHGDEGFNSADWRDYVFQHADRAGLAATGDLSTASEVLLPPDSGERRVKDELADSPRLRALLSYAVSEEFVLTRKALGYRVESAN